MGGWGVGGRARNQSTTPRWKSLAASSCTTNTCPPHAHTHSAIAGRPARGPRARTCLACVARIVRRLVRSNSLKRVCISCPHEMCGHKKQTLLRELVVGGGGGGDRAHTNHARPPARVVCVCAREPVYVCSRARVRACVRACV